MTEPHPTIRPREGILQISPYVGGEAKLPGVNRVLKLSSNENPLGPSAKAVEAFQAAAASLELYPDGGHAALRNAIGEVHGLDPARIVCGVGSDEIIAFLCQCYGGPGAEVIHTEHGFHMYAINALASGATPVEVPEAARHTDVDAILEACTEATRLVFIANPNNPTGTLISQSEVARLAEGLPDHALLVLDGAYVEYVQAPGFDAGLALVEARDNVVMTRTFSKLYGLGGMRVGFGYGPAHVVDALSRVRGPFNLSAAALAAAEAAVLDRAWADHCVAQNAQWRDWLAAALAEIGIPSDPSHANFILARFDSATTADAADAALKARGVIVRKVAGYNLPQCLRITIGDEDACRLIADILSAFMEGR